MPDSATEPKYLYSMATLKKCGRHLFFNSCNKLIVYSEGDIKIVHLPKPLQKLDKNIKESVDVNISCFSVSKDNKYIAVSSENKQVVIFDEYFEIWKSFTVARITSAMCFTCSNSLIVADKTGDVFSYDLTKDEEPKPTLMLGHLSVVLDVTMTDCEKYVITCDRDEKIRVSNFPNSYNIQSFCLGHEEFVLSIVVVQNKLISASGDGTVRFWDYMSGKQLSILNTNEYINDNFINQFKEEMNSQDVEVFALPITDLQYFATQNTIFLGISLYQYKKLLLFSLNTLDLKLNFCKHVHIGESFSFHLTDELLILTNYQIRKLKLTKGNYKGETQKVIDFNDVHDLHLKNTNNISILYKKKFDNVDEYIERKKARLKLK